MGLFDALAADELQVGTHDFYGDIADGDLDVAISGVQELGLENQDGDITYTDFKVYIEGKDVDTSAGKAPSNLVASLMTDRMDVWLEDNEVTRIFSPRSWRAKLTGDDSYMTKSPKKGGRKAAQDDE